MVRQRIKQGLKILIIAIALSLSYCGCPGQIDYHRTDQEFTTSHGIKVYPQGNLVAPEEIEKATEIFVWDLVLTFPCLYKEQEVRDKLKEISIYIEEQNFRCVIRQGDVVRVTFCKGVFDISDDSIKYANKCCIGDTAFVHEMIHAMNHYIEGFNDYNHERRKFFGDEEGSLEYDTNQYIKDEMCECSCWP